MALVVGAYQYPPEVVLEMSRKFISGMGLAEGEPVWMTLAGGMAADRPVRPVELAVTRRVMGWAGWVNGQASWRWVGDRGDEPTFRIPPAPGLGRFNQGRMQIVYLAMSPKPAGPITYIYGDTPYRVSHQQSVTLQGPVMAGVSTPQFVTQL